MLTLRGFMKPHNIGPGWYRIAEPDPHEIQAVVDLRFEHVLPAHGVPVIGRASQLYQPKVSELITKWDAARGAA
jgi:hypothetical protein